MDGELDPRWNRAGSPNQTANLKNPVERTASFNAKPEGSAGSGSYSIVFSASWVRITHPIGEGAFSRVYEGIYTNPETGEQSVVAVKILKKNMLKRRSDCLRFIKEAKIMTKISHRNIAACYGIGKYDDEDEQNPGSLFIVQELVKGGNLLHKVYKQMLNRQKYVYSSQEALQWLLNVAEGMQYLHTVTENKPMIIHRDLKLENIMLSPDSGSMCKLVDFGLHKVIDDRIKKVVKRVASEVQLGGARLGRRPPVEEVDEDDELEVALAEQRAMMAVGGSAQVSNSPQQTNNPTSAAAAQAHSQVALSRFAAPVRQSSSKLTMMAHAEGDEEGEQEGEEEEEEEEEHPQPVRSPLSRMVNAANAAAAAGADAASAAGASPASAAPGGSSADPKAKLRRLPERQSSMQKLMAKMKEIKLRVVGRMGDNPEEKPAPPPEKPALQMTPPPGVSAEKMAKNAELLNRIIAQQSTAAQSEAASKVADDLGIMDGAMGNRAPRRAPPRRAVTWVNEIRYNLTEAVGSWAYMAPEVVLGQPYNEKVDVFSFGVILFEVLNRKLMLVDEIKNDPRKDAQAYAERVAHGFRPEIPKNWPPQLVELISASWAQDPHMRPNFTAVVDILRELEKGGSVGKLDAQYWGRGSAFI